MEARDNIAGAGRRRGCRVWSLLLAALLAYGAAQVFVRTGVFRSLVEARLSRLAGMEVRTGRIRATASLNLRIRDVMAVSDRAGFEARLVRIRWRLFRPRGASLLESVRVDGLTLTAAPGADSGLQPAFLGNWPGRLLARAGLPVPADLAEPARPDRAAAGGPVAGLRVPRVVLSGVSLQVLDAQGQGQVAAAGMEIAWTALELADGRVVAHLGCRAAELKVAGRPRIVGLRLELLEAAGQRFLLALDAADWGGLKPAGQESADLLRALE